jgi:hypothetical protein
MLTPIRGIGQMISEAVVSAFVTVETINTAILALQRSNGRN